MPGTDLVLAGRKMMVKNKLRKFFNREGKRCSLRDWLSINKILPINESIIGDRLKITLDHHGEFDANIPDLYCNIFRVHIWNLLDWGSMGSSWKKEPFDVKNGFHTYNEALERYEVVRKELSEKRPTDLVTNKHCQTITSDDDISDYGEPEVPKDMPKTKSKNVGSW